MSDAPLDVLVIQILHNVPSKPACLMTDFVHLLRELAEKSKQKISNAYRIVVEWMTTLGTSNMSFVDLPHIWCSQVLRISGCQRRERLSQYQLSCLSDLEYPLYYFGIASKLLWETESRGQDVKLTSKFSKSTAAVSATPFMKTPTIGTMPPSPFTIFAIWIEAGTILEMRWGLLDSSLDVVGRFMEAGREVSKRPDQTASLRRNAITRHRLMHFLKYGGCSTQMHGRHVYHVGVGIEQ